MRKLIDGLIPSRTDFDAVLQFLPALKELQFRRLGDTFDEGKRELTVGGFVYAEKIEAFLSALKEHGFIQMFEWAAWHQEAHRYFEQPALIAEADLQACIKLLTFHVRSDRFLDGHFASMLASGHITAILNRLRELRDNVTELMRMNVPRQRPTFSPTNANARANGLDEKGQMHKMALGCFGYGRWDADCWFIGPEQGMSSQEDISRRVEAWIKLGEKDLEDCRIFHEQIGELRWHGSKPKLQKTWKQLMLLLMAYEGNRLDMSKPQDEQRLRVYQRDSWGRETGNTCVIELSGLPAHSYVTSRQQKSNLFEPAEFEAIRDKRIRKICERLLQHKPKLVIMYGLSEKKHWNRIATFINEKFPHDVPLPAVRIVPHPVGYGIGNAHWEQLGTELRQSRK